MKKNSLLLRPVLAGLALILSSHAFAQDKTGLKTSIAVDLVGAYGGSKESSAPDSFVPRGLDIMFYAPVDHLFDGTVSIAAHQEDGESLVELHEAYLSSNRLLPGLSVKAGQYFLSLGRLNSIHQHEWPFISAPLVHERFFGEEGLIDSGLEASYLLPSDFFLDITVGASNGFTFGHAHNAGEKPRSPNTYLRLKSFASLGDFDIQPGLSFLNRRDAENDLSQFFGFDLTGKVRQGKVLRYFWQSELWQRHFTPNEAKTEITTGGYAYAQYGFDNGLALGLRYDYLTINTLKNPLGESLSNQESLLTPSLFFRASEFSRLGLSYQFGQKTQSGEKDVDHELLEFQITYSLGAHPSHGF